MDKHFGLFRKDIQSIGSEALRVMGLNMGLGLLKLRFMFSQIFSILTVEAIEKRIGLHRSYNTKSYDREIIAVKFNEIHRACPLWLF